jgi:hypothetical protein
MRVALTGSLSAPTSTQYSASIFDKSTFITTGTPTIVSNEVVFGDITNWDLPTINRNGFVTYKVTFDGNIDRFVTQRLNTTSDGETGPGIVFRGGWTGSVDYKFQENNRRDAVLFDKNGDGTPEMYYATLQPSGPSTTPILPSGSVDSSDYWEELGEEDFFVAAKIAIFEESFVKNTLNVGTPAEGGSEAGIVINGRDSESTYISIGQPVIGFQQTGIFQGVSGSNNQTPYLSLQSATGSNGEYRSLEWDGSQLTIRGGIRQTAAGVVVTESINRGTWEIGSIYEIGNIVQYGEIGLPTASYSAIQSHTASFSNNPPSASFWSVFAVGKDGIDGAPGGSGSDAKTVQLTATSQVFRKANDGTIEPSSIDFTASLQNTVDTLATFTSSSNAPLTISGNTATLTTSSFGSNTRVTYTAAADSLSDSITIILVEDGSNAIQPILSNEAHVIPTDSDGNNGDFGGSGTLLQVFEGTTPLIYSSGAPGTFPLDDGRFRVEITNNGVSGGTALNVGDGTTTASLQPLTGMSNDTGSRTFTVRYRRLNSETGSLQKIQSFAKSRAGVSGSDGVDGQDGQDGLPGPGIVYRGEWAPNKFYRGTATRKDVVLASNDIHYIAQSNHISSIGFVQPWQSNESYKIGDVVLFTTSSDLSAYEAKISHNSTVSNPPETATDTNEWSFIGFTDLLASDGVMVDFQTGFSEPPNSKWEPFGATFTSIATSFILTEDAVATRSISVGENAAITIFGSGSSPYISIGQANGSQGFNQTGIFAGIVNDTGSLSLKSATDVVSWNGNDFNISGSNSSLVISGLGGETRIEGGKLTTIDGVFQGRIDACAGSVGGFNIESGFLTSCNNRILIDGANNIISINDINDSTKFIANTDVALPSTQASETGTLFLTSSTDSISSDSTLPYVELLPTTATASLGILTPENTAEYSIIWRNTTADNIYACATGPSTSAQAGIRLRVECTNGCLINQTNIQSVTVSGGKNAVCFDGPRTYYEPTTQCAILPNNTFNLKANLESGSAYCVNVVKIGFIEHGGAETNPDGNVIPSCTSVSIPITAQTTACYSATPSYTLINGGGFQSVVDTGEYLRVGKKGQFSETVRVEGSIQLQGTDINNRFIRFIPKSDQAQFWIVNSLGDESFITGSGTVGGLLFGTGERPGCVPPSTGWGTGTPLMNLTNNGNLILTGSVSSQGNFSDYNLKDNLTVIDSPMDKVTAINGYTYTWNSASYTPGKLDGGVVAQEVECILPSLVGTTTIDNTEYKTVSYNGIIGLLVESVKELSSEICSLKTELACIKSTII